MHNKYIFANISKTKKIRFIFIKKIIQNDQNIFQHQNYNHGIILK